MERVRDVLRHLGPGGLVEARRVEDEQERRAAAGVEHDRQADAAVLLLAAGLTDEHGLAGMAAVLVPGADGAVRDVDLHELVAEVVARAVAGAGAAMADAPGVAVGLAVAAPVVDPGEL